MGFSVLRFWLFFRSVFRFLLQKTSVFRFWWSLRFADFSFFSIWFSVFVKNTSGFSVLVPDVVRGVSEEASVSSEGQQEFDESSDEEVEVSADDNNSQGQQDELGASTNFLL